MKNTLYVLGNGFDLWHGLPTSYGDFYEYANQLLDEISHLYAVDLSECQPWADFENLLGTFDWGSYFDSFNEVDVTAEDFRPKHIYGLEDELTEQADALVSNLNEAFSEWINHIDVLQTEVKVTFEEQSKFITFNYTSTLQLVYSIPDSSILHIHGQAAQNEDLVFGHGEVTDINFDIDEEGNNIRGMFSDAEEASRYPFYATKKPVFEIVERYKGYFKDLKGTEEIVVIGHSLNEIDIPYFRQIAASLPEAKWKICFHNETDVRHFESQLANCGVELSQVVFIPNDELLR